MAKDKPRRSAVSDPADRAAALALYPLPAAIAARFDVYAALLVKWQATINLVAASTLPQLWTRHVADSLQVQAALPDARLWADLGSGAGFPGLVTAIRLAETPGAKVHLIESNQRKCAFLREVSRETQAPAEVHCGRIEIILPQLGRLDAVSARALAPLPQLLTYADSALQTGATGVFLKGEHLEDELTASAAADYFGAYAITPIRSQTAARSQLLVVRRKTGVDSIT